MTPAARGLASISAPSVSGALPVKLTGKIGGADSRMGIEADLTALKLDNILPGWVKLPGKSSRAVFNVVQKPQSTRFEDIVIDGGGVSIKGSLEVDQNRDLINANFPTYAPSEGDKASLKAERGADGVVKVTMRGDVFDGRGFLKSAMSGKEADAKSKASTIDFDVDLKLGAVAGYFGEALRSVDCKVSRRGGVIKNFALSGKLGRDTPLIGDLRGRAQGRDVIYLETDDAGAFFRFTDTYSKVVGGQLQMIDGSPDGRTFREIRGDQCAQFLREGRGGARPAGGGRTGRRAERCFVLGGASGIHAAKWPAHDPRWRPERRDHRRHHRRQHRLPRQPGTDERHFRADVRAEQHVRPDSDFRAVPRRQQ